MSQAHADCPHCRQDGSEAKHIALKEVRIALAGNPNCGKTTAFNEYTGTHQHVGNYLTQLIQLPVCIENDTRSMAFAELIKGQCKGRPSHLP